MTDELLFTVHGAKAYSATPMSVGEAGLKERQDLQEWVLDSRAFAAYGEGDASVLEDHDAYRLVLDTSSRLRSAVEAIGLAGHPG